MRGTIEISMYPLNESFVEPIKDFIQRLNKHEGLDVETNATSTRVSGDYDRVIAIVTGEMRRVHSAGTPRAVFVLKVLCSATTG
jgi:uncharacterized protein YqgV (UPF0045/DUF77 family)